MAKVTYATKINGSPLAASAIVPGSALDSEIAEIKQEITAMGAFEVVPLTSGANPVPDVAEPKTNIIYLTKEAGSAKTDPYTEWIYIPADATKEPPVTAHWEVIGETSIDLSGYKTKQSEVNVTGGTLKGVASFSQNENGEVTLTLNDIQDGTTSQKGVVQLAGSIGATVASENNKAATEKAVRDAINDLDVSSITGFGAGQTLATLTETDGKIAATFQEISIASYQIDDKMDYYDGTGLSKDKVITGEGVKDAIDTLAVTDLVQDSSGSMAGKTLLTLSETSGKIAATFQNIQIAESQVTNLTTDLASKQDNLSFEGTYDASTNKVATESTVSDAIEALDVGAISVGADKTLSSISETDGKISATPVSIQIAESQVTNLTTDLDAKANKSEMSVVAGTGTDADKTTITLKTGTSATVLTAHQDITGKADKVSGATSGNFAGLDANGNLTNSGSKASDFATAAQGALAASAVQGVTMNGTDVVDSTTKIAAIPAATTPTPSGSVETTGAYGVVQITVMAIGDDDED